MASVDPGSPTAAGNEVDGDDIQDAVRKRLPLSAVPLVPEIRLHVATPSSGLSSLAGAASPYWAYPWAGGLALARYILDHPRIVRCRRVLDLGSGSGLVVIAAAKTGAASVIAAEVDPQARMALALNLDANGVTASIIGDDMTAGAPPPVDVVLVGDLFYTRALARRVTKFLDRCAVDNIDVLIGDPWRSDLPLARLRCLADYRLPDFGAAGPVKASVFSFTRRDRDVVTAPRPRTR